jgi:membrane protein
MCAAVGLTATITSHSVVQNLMEMEPIGHVLILTGKLIPYLLVIATFTFIYIFIPNTRVKVVPALVGGVVAGVLWQTSGWIFAAFVATSPNYAAIYSGFAILVLLLIWLYLSWLILLLGSQVAFYVQHSQYLTREPVKLQLSNRLQERLALQLMYLIAEHHVYNREPWTLDSLVQYLGLPMQPVHKVLGLMVESGFLSETCDDQPAYLPRRDIDTILVSQLYDLVRSAGENRLLTIDSLPGEVQVEQILVAVDKAAHEAMGDCTLKELVTAESLADRE